MSEPIIARGAITADGASFAMREWAHGAMDGPPLHVHHHDDEAWHVLDGTLWFRFVDRTVDVAAGGTVFVPAGVAHSFGSRGDVRYLIVSTPRVFALIEALHDPANTDHAAVYRAHDAEIVE